MRSISYYRHMCILLCSCCTNLKPAESHYWIIRVLTAEEETLSPITNDSNIKYELGAVDLNGNLEKSPLTRVTKPP